MHLESTARINLGLLMFFARQDLRYVKKIELEVHDPQKQQISLLSEGIYKHASVEAEIVINSMLFKAIVDLDSVHWDEFIMTFFQDESPMVSNGEASYKYTNKSAFEFKNGYGLVFDRTDAPCDVI
ncbi:MAG: hypothetical protein IKE91_07960 [Clostridia bacterium]|nr:hypothetical protein [Clostridia bacterium]